MSLTPHAPNPTSPIPPGTGIEVKVRGESSYDRVTALLLAVVLGTLLSFGYLVVMYATTQAYAARVAAPLEILFVAGGGGSPEGEVGSVEDVPIPDAGPEELASNNEADASTFEAPMVLESPPTMLDAAAEAANLLADASQALTGGPVASGKRASRIGSGVPGFGPGGGGAGFGAEERWSILYNPGQTLDEYARQLDALGVELATIQDSNTLLYASNFTSDQPRVRPGPAGNDNRLYFAWQGQGRKASDVELLKKAGIEVGDRPILQFYPPNTEQILARLEVQYRGLQPTEIRVTRFRVVPRGDAYEFAVLDQQALR